MPRRRSPSIVVLVVAVPALAVACNVFRSLDLCASDGECSSGEVCDREGRFCISKTPEGDGAVDGEPAARAAGDQDQFDHGGDRGRRGMRLLRLRGGGRGLFGRQRTAFEGGADSGKAAAAELRGGGAAAELGGHGAHDHALLGHPLPVPPQSFRGPFHLDGAADDIGLTLGELLALAAGACGGLVELGELSRHLVTLGGGSGRRLVEVRLELGDLLGAFFERRAAGLDPLLGGVHGRALTPHGLRLLLGLLAGGFDVASHLRQRTRILLEGALALVAQVVQSRGAFVELRPGGGQRIGVAGHAQACGLELAFKPLQIGGARVQVRLLLALAVLRPLDRRVENLPVVVQLGLLAGHELLPLGRGGAFGADGGLGLVDVGLTVADLSLLAEEVLKVFVEVAGEAFDLGGAVVEAGGRVGQLGRRGVEVTVNAEHVLIVVRHRGPLYGGWFPPGHRGREDASMRQKWG